MTMEISKDDVYEAQRSGDYIPEWTFNTSAGYRIRFEFQYFSFYWSSSNYSALEIGDGLTRGADTRLVHFRGLYLPSNVTSVSSSAWIRVYGSFVLGDGMIRELNLTASAVPKSG